MVDIYQTVLLFGPPGAGKGTQGRILGQIPGFFHTSCGDIFRRMNPNSEIGRVFMEYSARGELVPDDLTVQSWQKYIDAQVTLNAYKPESDLLVLDGIPRNVAQARIMEPIINVLSVVELHCADEKQMIERLRRRALKENRFDDAKEDVIRNRWEVYREETQPVLDYYPDSIHHRIDAVQSPAGVLHDILDVLKPVQAQHFETQAVSSAW